jgi:hypothetical protein
MSETKPTEVIDADAFDPLPTRQVKIGSSAYGALSVLDVDQLTLMKLKRFDDHLKLLELNEQIAFISGLIMKFVPTLPSEVLSDWPANKLIWLLGKVTAPPKGEVADPLAMSPAASN